jgi:hypothetical protein
MQAIFWFITLRPLLTRIQAAPAHPDRAYQKSQRWIRLFRSWNKLLVVITAALVVAVLGFSLYWMQTPATVEVDENELVIKVVDGEVTAIGFITVLVTHEGNPVADALITLNTYDRTGQTGADGLISFTLPDDNQVVIEAKAGELKGELVIDLG